MPRKSVLGLGRVLKLCFFAACAANGVCVLLLSTALRPPSVGGSLFAVYGKHPVYASEREAREILQEGLGAYLGSAEFDDLLSFRYPPLSTPALHIDAHGDRVVPGAPASPSANEIHLFGGSTLFGWGVRDEDAIGAWMQRLLGDRKVVSHAQVSYTSFQNLVLYQEILDRIPASATIVFYDGKNDFWVGCWESQQTRTIQSARNRLLWQRGLAAGRSPALDWLGFFYQPLLRALEHAGSGGTEAYAPLLIRSKLRCQAESWRKQVLESMLRNWESARAITEMRGGRFMAFLHPHLVTSDVRPTYLPAGLRDDDQAFRYVELYREAASALRDAPRPWAVDLTRLYDYASAEMLLLDYTHPTPRGNELAARAIVEQIRALEAELPRPADSAASHQGPAVVATVGPGARRPASTWPRTDRR